MTRRLKGSPIGPVFVIAGVYALAGIGFGALAAGASSQQLRLTWRWAAWAVSAAAFAMHIAYEQSALRSLVWITALRVSVAAGLGAFALAVAANIHRLRTPVSPTQHHAVALGLSLVIWPVVTALPAFVVALLTAGLYSRFVRSDQLGSGAAKERR